MTAEEAARYGHIDTFDDLRDTQLGELAAAAGGSAFASAAGVPVSEPFSLAADDLESSVTTTKALRKRIAAVEQKLDAADSSGGEVHAVTTARVEMLNSRVHELGEDLDRYVKLLQHEREAGQKALREQQVAAHEVAENRERQFRIVVEKLKADHASALDALRSEKDAERTRQAARSAAASLHPQNDKAPASTNAIQPKANAGQPTAKAGAKKSATPAPPAKPVATPQASTSRGPNKTSEHADQLPAPVGILVTRQAESAETTDSASETRLRHELEHTRDKVGRLTDRVTAAEIGRQQLQQKLAETTKKLEQSSGQAQALRATVQSLRSQVQPDGGAPIDDTAANKRLVHERSVMEAALGEIEKRHREHVADLAAEHHHTVADLRDQFEERLADEQAVRHGEVAEQRQRRALEVSSLTRSIQDLESRLASTPTASRATDRRLKKAQLELQRMVETVDELRAANALLERRLAVAVGANDETAEARTLRQAHEAMSELRQELDIARASATRSAEERDQLAERLEQQRAIAMVRGSDSSAADAAAEHVEAIERLRHEHDLAIEELRLAHANSQLAFQQDFEAQRAEAHERHRTESAEQQARHQQALSLALSRTETAVEEAVAAAESAARSEAADQARRLESIEVAYHQMQSRLDDAEDRALEQTRALALSQTRLSEMTTRRDMRRDQLEQRLRTAEQRLVNERRAIAADRAQALNDQMGAAKEVDTEHREALERIAAAEAAIAQQRADSSQKMAELLELAEKRSMLAADREAELEAALVASRGAVRL